ncbi:MAG: helix-turn-helix domain-containing protein [Deltaproteobacteria bacterium]|nr:helix-turn-helix domain-containing protein [Deltaproteobacteria bacterium]
MAVYLARGSKVVLKSAEGFSDEVIAVSLNLKPSTVARWRRLYIEKGVAGFFDSQFPGAPAKTAAELSQASVRMVLAQPPPAGKAKWDVESVASEIGAVPSEVWKIMKDLNIKI